MAVFTATPEEDCWVRGQSNTSSADAVAANGSLLIDNRGNTAYVNAGGNYYCARTYYRFDTTALPTNAVASESTITINHISARGSTADATEVHKLFSSSDNSSSASSALYQTITSTGASTTTDVSNTVGTKVMAVDGDLLTYLNTQLAAGAKPAFLLRNKGDYDVATEGNASGVNTRAFDGTASGTAPVLKIIYETVATVTHNAIFFGTNF
jgi:hypothetical protein